MADFSDDPYFECLGWQEGRTLSAVDVERLKRVLDDHNDMIMEHVDQLERLRRHLLLEIGGMDLVKALVAKDQAEASRTCKRAIAKAYERINEINNEMNQ